MKKIISWFSIYVAGCNSATQIRNAFANLQSVKNTMIAINVAIITTLIGAILAPWLYPITWEAASVFFGILTIWFWRLRIAVATSQQARENFIRETLWIVRRLLSLAFAIAMTMVFLAWMAVVLATTIELGMMDQILHIYPELEPLSKIIVEKFSTLINQVLVFLT